MKSEVKRITPDIARELLKNNSINRPLSMANIEFLKKEILEGRWQVTHQGLCIAKDGTLVDGQHRLQAIIKADQEVDILVTSEMEKDIFKLVDRGKRRNNSDIFSIEGYSYSKELPALVNKIIRWNERVSLSERKHLIDIDTQLNFARMNVVDLYEALNATHRVKKPVYSKSVAAFVYWILDKKNISSNIFDQIMSGITTDQYVVNFRNELIDNQIKRVTMDVHLLVSKTFHAILCSMCNKKRKMPEYSIDLPYDLLDEIIKVNRRVLTTG